jgi:VWFA-related protein
MQRIRCAIAVSLIGLATPLLAQFSERIDVIAVEVPISVRDRAGKVPADLTQADFEVREDGVRQEVIGLAYPVAYVGGSAPRANANAARPRWQIVMFLQESVSTTSGLRRAVKGLLEQVDTLTAMGDVEIISDYPSPHVILAATGDPGVLHGALVDLQRKSFGHEEVMQLRKFYELEHKRERRTREMTVSDAVFTANIEASLIRRRQDGMLAWMARYAAGNGAGQRLLLLISDGYALEPINYYAKSNPTSADLSGLRSLTSAPAQDELAKTIAAQGWVTYSVAAGAMFQMTGTQSITELSYNELTGSRSLMMDVLDSIRMLDDETGGKLTTDTTLLGRDLESFTQRLTLTYRVRRARDGKFHRLDIRALRPGLSVESQHAVMSGSPESVATARATALAMNFGQRGELPVTCTVQRGGPAGEQLVVSVDLTPFAAARASMQSSIMRVAIAVAPDKKYPFNELQNSEKIDLSSMTMWQTTVPIRGRGNAPTAIVVEELATGAWGGARCEAQR